MRKMNLFDRQVDLDEPDEELPFEDYFEDLSEDGQEFLQSGDPKKDFQNGVIALRDMLPDFIKGTEEAAVEVFGECTEEPNIEFTVENIADCCFAIQEARDLEGDMIAYYKETGKAIVLLKKFKDIVRKEPNLDIGDIELDLAPMWNMYRKIKMAHTNKTADGRLSCGISVLQDVGTLCWTGVLKVFYGIVCQSHEFAEYT